jgi:4-aminobutyrate aminotransferase-like enzyme
VTGADYAAEVGQVIGKAVSGGRSIAAFFAEPLLSCGGQLPLPEGYLAAAFEHVRAAGGVCIADEVQVGFGRVGDAMWGFELQGVVPDIVVMGKPIGNGHPLGAVVCTRQVAEAFDSGMEFFSTFGGNPVSAAVGMAVLDVIERESLQGRAAKLGARFMAGLEDLRDRHALIGDVRGRGLFLGIELVRDHETLEPADAEASAIVNAMKDRGVLLSTDGPLHNVIKIKPPMVLSQDDVDMALRELDNVLAEC